LLIAVASAMLLLKKCCEVIVAKTRTTGHIANHANGAQAAVLL
jgi:hypothetical protein